MTSSLLRIGTAGWTIPTRHADRVPAGGSHLQRYAARLDAVEINSSFHRPHQRKTYERWAQSTPASFAFSVKLPKQITHDLQLQDCDAALDRFVDEVSGLGDKLLVLLVQLPPSFAYDGTSAGAFFETLRQRIAIPVAVEPRHADWFTPQVESWLAACRVARVAADPARIEAAGTPGGWDGLTYYRWHGAPRMYYSDYDAGTLSALKQQLYDAQKRKVPTWCIFDNTASGAALGNALTLQAEFT